MQRLLPYLTALFTATFVLAPLVTAPFTGYEADQIPVYMDQPPIQPAGYAFSIWGLIYSWLVLSAVYGLIKRRYDGAWQITRGPLALSLALGTLWLAIANATVIWATVIIVIMAGLAILALLRSPSKDRWWLKVPVGLYAGWLTAASCVSFAIMVAGYGIMSYQAASILFLIIAMVAAIAIKLMPPSGIAYGAAVIWALVGVIMQNSTDNLVMSVLSVIGILAIAAVIIRRDFA